jgi:hypothetical protein
MKPPALRGVSDLLPFKPGSFTPQRAMDRNFLSPVGVILAVRRKLQRENLQGHADVGHEPFRRGEEFLARLLWYSLDLS